MTDISKQRTINTSNKSVLSKSKPSSISESSESSDSKCADPYSYNRAKKNMISSSSIGLQSDVPKSYIHRFREYFTGDVLILDDDSTAITILCHYLNRIKLKRNDRDEGRKLHINTCTNGIDAIERIVTNKETYAFILVDNFLGPFSPSGREVIRILRKSGYEGAIVYVTCVPEMYKYHLIEVGTDAILFKGMPNLGTELKKLVADLTVRDKVFKKLKNRMTV